MEILKFLAAGVLTLLCAYLILTLIETFRWRQSMTHVWFRLAFEVVMIGLCGVGIYQLY